MKPDQAVCPHCGFDERTQNEVNQLPIGTVLENRYVIGKVLGQGGFGITYMALDSVLDMRVAIKEYYPQGIVTRDYRSKLDVTCQNTKDRAAFAATRDRFYQEAKTLAKFSNIPQVVHVINFFLSNNTAYIVMEYVEGMDLKHYIRSKGRPLSVQETLILLLPVMQAMDRVHRENIIHRDISPDNIMVLPDGSVKLLDFGAVREVEDPNAEEELEESTAAIRKEGFAPIEQYHSRGSLGPWTDVYAMCGTIYYCLTGKVPLSSVLRMVEGKDLNWTSIPGLSQGQIRALTEGMALRAKDRLSSMEALWKGLRDSGGSSGNDSGKKPPYQKPEDMPKTEPAPQAPRVHRPQPRYETPEDMPRTEPTPQGPAASATRNRRYETPEDMPVTNPALKPSDTQEKSTDIKKPGAGSSSPKLGKKWLLIGLAAAVICAWIWAGSTSSGNSDKTQLSGSGRSQCDHEWIAATCTEAMKCAECGETKGEPLGHKWTQVTCGETASCVRCGITSVREHEWREPDERGVQFCAYCTYVYVNYEGDMFHDPNVFIGPRCQTILRSVDGKTTISLDPPIAAHTFDNGVCTVCGFAGASATEAVYGSSAEPPTEEECEHTWYDGQCADCGMLKLCNDLGHEWEADCGGHQPCSRCGLEHTEHTFVDAVCTGCGVTAACSKTSSGNHFFVPRLDMSVGKVGKTYSVCSYCGNIRQTLYNSENCDHKWGNPDQRGIQKCTQCPTKIRTVEQDGHTYVGEACDASLNCTKCEKLIIMGEAIEHEFDGAKCVVCGFEKECPDSPSGLHVYEKIQPQLGPSYKQCKYCGDSKYGTF